MCPVLLGDGRRIQRAVGWSFEQPTGAGRVLELLAMARGRARGGISAAGEPVSLCLSGVCACANQAETVECRVRSGAWLERETSTRE